MGASIGGQHPLWIRFKYGVWVFYGSTGFHINVGGPIDGFGIRVCAQQFAGLAINDVEKTVFGGLQ